MTELRVEMRESPSRLAELSDEWRLLFASAGEPNPFLSFEWLDRWWRSFGGGRRLRVLEARDAAGRLCGALALMSGGALRPGRRWQLLGNGLCGADGLDALVAGPGATRARAALWEAALDAPGWDLYDLEDLPAGSPSLRLLHELAAWRGIESKVARRFACPGFALRGSFEGHLFTVRRRETFRRRVRWLERQPGFRIEVATAEEAGEAMRDLLRLHRLRWEAEGGSYGIPPGPAEAFHLALAPAFAARGWLRLYRLFLGGEAIAAVYGLELGRRFYYYQSGYHPAWAARSPGVVLLGRTIEDAFARGLTDYDFLRGEEAYKRDWTADRRETCAVRLRARSVRAEVDRSVEGAYRAARDAARAALPPRLWAALQRARHQAEAGRGRAGWAEPGGPSGRSPPAGGSLA
ncbi:MAG TPA: GNAT family N-acetyltransferase [Anaeromyxobacter sp.]|nr:GNAT family N-acetyltransferase [Anaeromyxobacter sp.]